VAERQAIRGRTLVTLSQEQRFNRKYVPFWCTHDNVSFSCWKKRSL